MDLVFTIILVALVGWHVCLAIAFSAWCGWEMIVEPVHKLWLRLRAPAQVPMIDMREARGT